MSKNCVRFCRDREFAPPKWWATACRFSHLPFLSLLHCWWSLSSQIFYVRIFAAKPFNGALRENIAGLRQTVPLICGRCNFISVVFKWIYCFPYGVSRYTELFGKILSGNIFSSVCFKLRAYVILYRHSFFLSRNNLHIWYCIKRVLSNCLMKFLKSGQQLWMLLSAFIWISVFTRYLGNTAFFFLPTMINKVSAPP